VLLEAACVRCRKRLVGAVGSGLCALEVAALRMRDDHLARWDGLAPPGGFLWDGQNHDARS
jgi:hypothetical protein